MACGVNSSCKKILGADGMHYRHPKYNGILLSMHTIDGDGCTMLVAIAIVPVESEQHWHWFFSLYRESGVTFEDKVLFVDRDKGSIAAALQMANEGMQINMRWCTQHIVRNCINKFGISTNDAQFRAYVFGLQGAKSVSDHQNQLQLIASEYGSGVAEYLRSINPISWMQYANTASIIEQMENWCSLNQNDSTQVSTQDAAVVSTQSEMPVSTQYETAEVCTQDSSSTHEVSMQDSSIRNVLVGIPMCMYGVRDTNFVEGQNGLFAKKGFRDCLPYRSLRHYHDYMVNQAFE